MKSSSDLRYISATAAIASALLLMSPMLAFAASPHFKSASSSLDLSKTDPQTGLTLPSLTCTFKEEGLGNHGSSNIKETCSATATATYECVNNGGNQPASKETVTAPVTADGFFPIRNGQTAGTITVAARGPGSFSCPSGQTLYGVSVFYTNVCICDQLGNCPCALDQPEFGDQRYTNQNAP